MKKVSVIIPAYNAEKYIKKCINSVLCQTYTDFEIIVVNDGSTDKTGKILTELQKNDDRIKVITQKNGGVSSARNAGINAAEGKFISFADADDTMLPTALETLVELMADDVDFIIASYNTVMLKKTQHILKPRVYNNFDEVKKDFLNFNSMISLITHNFYRTSVIKNNRVLYDTEKSYGEDHLFNLTYSKNTAGKIIVSDKIVYNYNYLRDGLSTKFHPDMNKNLSNMMLSFAEVFGGVENLPRDFVFETCKREILFLTDYYIIYMKKADAIKKIAETFEKTYGIFLTDEIMAHSFTDEERNYIKNCEYGKFADCYIKRNHFKPIVKKITRRAKVIMTKFV